MRKFIHGVADAMPFHKSKEPSCPEPPPAKEEEVQDFAKRLLHHKPPFRAEARDALVNRGEEGAAIAAALLGDREYEVRVSACEVLGRLGAEGKVSKKTAKALADRLVDTRTLVVAAAAKALGQLGKVGEPHTAALAALFAKDKETTKEVRVAACQSLGLLEASSPSHGHVTVIVALLEDEDPSVRAAACDALGGWGKAAVPHAEILAKLLADKCEVADRACIVLGGCGKVGADLAGRILRESTNEFELQGACKALAGTGEAAQPHCEAMAEVLRKSEDYQTQSAACRSFLALGEVGAPHCQAIASMLKSSYFNATREACLALAKLGPLGAVPCVAEIAAFMEKTESDWDLVPAVQAMAAAGKAAAPYRDLVASHQFSKDTKLRDAVEKALLTMNGEEAPAPCDAD